LSREVLALSTVLDIMIYDEYNMAFQRASMPEMSLMAGSRNIRLMLEVQLTHD
jgi:hypothetical protein